MTDAKIQTSWPYASLLFCGHFGGATPGSRRLNRHGYVAMAILLGSLWLTSGLPDSVPGGDWALVVGAAAASLIVVRGFQQYFAGLDELSLRIQYEAIAFAFSVTLVAAMVLGAISVVRPFELNPVFVMLAEPLRGVGLVRAARRYR